MQSQPPFFQLSADRDSVKLYLLRDWVELGLKIRTSRLVVILLVLLNVILVILAGGQHLPEFIERLLGALGQ